VEGVEEEVGGEGEGEVEVEEEVVDMGRDGVDEESERGSLLPSVGVAVADSASILCGLAVQAIDLYCLPSLTWIARRVSTTDRASTSSCRLSMRSSVADL